MSDANTPVDPNGDGDTESPQDVEPYEFREAESLVFARLAKEMSGVGLAQAVVGGALGVMAVAHVPLAIGPARVPAIPLLVTGALLAVTGVRLRRASEPLARIASTQGSDIRNLMRAMAALANMYAVQRLFYWVAGAITAVLLVGCAVLLLMFMPRFLGGPHM